MKLRKINKLRELVFGQLLTCDRFNVEPTQPLTALEVITRYMKFGHNPKDNVEVVDGELLFRVVKNKIYIYDNTRKKPKRIATLVLR